MRFPCSTSSSLHRRQAPRERDPFLEASKPDGRDERGGSDYARVLRDFESRHYRAIRRRHGTRRDRIPRRERYTLSVMRELSAGSRFVHIAWTINKVLLLDQESWVTVALSSGSPL